MDLAKNAPRKQWGAISEGMNRRRRCAGRLSPPSRFLAALAALSIQTRRSGDKKSSVMPAKASSHCSTPAITTANTASPIPLVLKRGEPALSEARFRQSSDRLGRFRRGRHGLHRDDDSAYESLRCWRWPKASNASRWPSHRHLTYSTAFAASRPPRPPGDRNHRETACCTPWAAFAGLCRRRLCRPGQTSFYRSRRARPWPL
jgi:hypothetical protein